MRIIGLITSLLLALGVFALVWGRFDLTIDTTDTAILWMSAAAFTLLVYLFIQAWATHSEPMHSPVWVALDVGFSVLPLFAAGMALLAYAANQAEMNTFQQAIIWLVLVTTLIDLLLIWVFFREHKHSKAEPATSGKGHAHG